MTVVTSLKHKKAAPNARDCAFEAAPFLKTLRFGIQRKIIKNVKFCYKIIKEGNLFSFSMVLIAFSFKKSFKFGNKVF